MKKLMIIIAIIFLSFSFLSAYQIEVTTDSIIRSAVMAKDNVGIAKAGDKYDVLEEIGSWHYVEITGGSIHVGKKGYVWQKLIDGKKILGDGAVIRSEPKTASDEVCRVKGGATYKLIKIKVKWYKIGENKYLYYYNTKKI